MHAKVLNLLFRRETGGFDDAPLAQFLEGKELVQVRDYFFTHEGRPYLSCFVQWNGARAPAAAPPARERQVVRERKPARERAKGGGAPPEGLDAAGERVFAALRAWRAERARERRIPAYRILTNRQLDALARDRPADGAALEQIPGVGPATIRTHGPEIVERIRAASSSA